MKTLKEKPLQGTIPPRPMPPQQVVRELGGLLSAARRMSPTEMAAAVMASEKSRHLKKSA